MVVFFGAGSDSSGGSAPSSDYKRSLLQTARTKVLTTNGSEFVLDGTDCNQVLEQVLSNLLGAIASSNAIITYENMPIRCQLFPHLVELL
ncbi:MAG: hypothetical protein GDA48_03120 [Hormoscilla sp. GM102CHS1]|nr:hypothetical protein [Hormoscilla sp. GM102CHS1]